MNVQIQLGLRKQFIENVHISNPHTRVNNLEYEYANAYDCGIYGGVSE